MHGQAGHDQLARLSRSKQRAQSWCWTMEATRLRVQPVALLPAGPVFNDEHGAPRAACRVAICGRQPSVGARLHAMLKVDAEWQRGSCTRQPETCVST